MGDASQRLVCMSRRSFSGLWMWGERRRGKSGIGRYEVLICEVRRRWRGGVPSPLASRNRGIVWVFKAVD